MPKNWITRFVSGFILILVTDAYRLITTYSPLSNSAFSALTLLITLTILFSQKKLLIQLVSQTRIAAFLVTFWLCPIFLNSIYMLIFSVPFIDTLYWTIKITWFNALFLLFLLYMPQITGRYFKVVFTCIISAAFLLNILPLSITQDVGVNYNVSLSYATYGNLGERLIGLFLHPNAASFSIILFALSLYVLNQLNTFIFAILISLVILTGSRTALAFSSLLLLFWVYNWVFKTFRFSHSNTVNTFFSLVGMTLFFPILLITISLSLGNDFHIRILDLLSTTNEDESLLIRNIAQQQYFGLLQENPVLGYGISTIRDYLESGRLIRQSHNMYIERMTQYGVIGLFTFIGFFGYLLHYYRRRHDTKKCLMILLLMMYGMFVNTFDQILMFYFAIAILLANPIRNKHEKEYI